MTLLWLQGSLAWPPGPGWGWGSGAKGPQGTQWGTRLLCGKPWLWAKGAVITGERALEMQGQGRQEAYGELVGHRGMQGKQSWCSGGDEGCTLTRVCSSESPVSAAMRHSVVGSGCLFTLQKLYSRISSCSSVGVTGFSASISFWAMEPGTAERGQGYCQGRVDTRSVLAELHLRHPSHHQLPLPQRPLTAAGHNSLPEGLCWEPCPLPAAPASLSWLWQQHSQPSCLTIPSWQERQPPLCRATSAGCCIYSPPDSRGDDSCLRPYLGLGVTRG